MYGDITACIFQTRSTTAEQYVAAHPMIHVGMVSSYLQVLSPKFYVLDSKTLKCFHVAIYKQAMLIFLFLLCGLHSLLHVLSITALY